MHIVYIFIRSSLVHGVKIAMVHSKNTRVSLTRIRVHWGQTPFRVHDDPEISQLDAEYDPELGQSDHIICPADRIPGRFCPEWSLAPMDPFSGSG